MSRQPTGLRPAIGSGGRHRREVRSPGRAGATGALLLALALVASSCSGAAGPATPARDRAPRLTWLVTSTALRLLTRSGVAREAMAGGRVYELGGPSQAGAGAGGLRLTGVIAFPSEAALASALGAGAVPAGDAVLYDPEAWSRTPELEQLHVARFLAEAGVVARQHHVTLLTSPGLDLSRIERPDRPGWTAYLSLGLAAAAARAGQAVVIQSQSLERRPGAFAAFVRAAARQARSARPGVVVLAGLSTNPPGPTVTLAQLERAVEASLGDVAGFWLNVPRPGATCPDCHARRPRLARELLAWLAAGRSPQP